MKKQALKTLLLVMAMSLTAANVSAQQNHQAVKKVIKKWSNCKNVAITSTKGDVALRGHHEYSAFDIPASLLDVLKKLHGQKELIVDFKITEDGRWCVIFGNNDAYYSDNIPEDLKQTIIDYKNRGLALRSITFNDRNEWMVVSDKYFTASSITLSNWVNDGLKKWGLLLAVDINDEMAVAVYEKGVRYRGEVPDSMRDALRKNPFDVYRLKVAGEAWFIANPSGECIYSL